MEDLGVPLHMHCRIPGFWVPVSWVAMLPVHGASSTSRPCFFSPGMHLYHSLQILHSLTHWLQFHTLHTSHDFAPAIFTGFSLSHSASGLTCMPAYCLPAQVPPPHGSLPYTHHIFLEIHSYGITHRILLHYTLGSCQWEVPTFVYTAFLTTQGPRTPDYTPLWVTWRNSG